MSAWNGLREEREVGRRLARRVAGLFEQGMGRRVVRDERFQRRVVRHGRCEVKFWRAGYALTPALGFSVLRRPTSCIHAVVSQRERVLGGAGWQVWSQPARHQDCFAQERSDSHR
ncbi:ABC transporter substrate-binding protein [Pseudomonas sp. MT3]